MNFVLREYMYFPRAFLSITQTDRLQIIYIRKLIHQMMNHCYTTVHMIRIICRELLIRNVNSQNVNNQKRNVEKLFSIAIIIDDFADSYEVSKSNQFLHPLYTRGRHSQISTFIATQKFNALATTLSVNADTLCVFRLRNYSDLSTFSDEVSGLVDKKTLLQM